MMKGKRRTRRRGESEPARRHSFWDGGSTYCYKHAYRDVYYPTLWRRM
jgi:hypothetical protein